MYIAALPQSKRTCRESRVSYRCFPTGFITSLWAHTQPKMVSFSEVAFNDCRSNVQQPWPESPIGTYGPLIASVLPPFHPAHRARRAVSGRPAVTRLGG